MHRANLRSLDLNLLRVLDALLAERHVTRAARRLGLSQPATSHALARLRDALGDPLLVRAHGGLVPTARAAQLEGPVRAALAALEQGLDDAPAFDPSRARRSFTLATADYGAFVVAPGLHTRLREVAPSIDLWLRTPGDDVFEQLSRGDADVSIGPLPQAASPASIHSTLLYEERFVCLVRRDHPRVKRQLDLDTWVSLPHAFVAPRGTPGGIVDEVLSRHGHTRRVAFAVPHFLVAPHVVATSDLVLTIGARVAEAFASILPLKIVEPPVPIPGFRVQLAWHARKHDDPAQIWLREQIAALFGETRRRRPRAP